MATMNEAQPETKQISKLIPFSPRTKAYVRYTEIVHIAPPRPRRTIGDENGKSQEAATIDAVHLLQLPKPLNESAHVLCIYVGTL